MTHHRIVWNIAVLTLGGTLALSGCKQSSTPQQANQTANEQAPQQPAQPGAEQSGSMPGVQTQPPAEQTQAANEAPGSYETQQAPAAAAPARVVVPAGTRLKVTLSRELGSRISEAGESFSVKFAQDVVVDGVPVIPRGARAEGTVVSAKARGHIKGAAVLALRLKTVELNGVNYPVTTNTYEKALAGKGKRSAKFIAGGGGLGALIGGVAGGGKGALIGAAAGAGAGTAGAAYTGNKQIVLPAGTLISFRLERALNLNE